MPKRLQSFVGTWETEGQQYESPLGPAAKVKARETYEWMTGRAFLVHRFEGRVGDKPAACIDVIGSESAGAYPVHTFYDNGFVGEWRLQERGPSWILTGSWPVGGKDLKVRCTLIDNGGDTLTSRWEYAEDGGDDWKPSWDVKSVRTSS